MTPPSPQAPLQLGDGEARRIAATDLASNIVVIAGAGTGKTSLLVERALVAIGTGLPVESLVAITFTEKAAAELRERLTSALEDLTALAAAGSANSAGSADASPRATDDSSAGPASTNRAPSFRGEAVRAHRHLVTAEGGAGLSADLVRDRAESALARLDDATIGTIHSFASELLRRNPIEAGVDPSFAVDEGRARDLAAREEWPAFLATQLGEDAGAGREAWMRALARFDIGDIEPVGRELIESGVDLGRFDRARGGERGRCANLLAPIAREALTPLASLLREKTLSENARPWIESAVALLTPFTTEPADSNAPGAQRFAEPGEEASTEIAFEIHRAQVFKSVPSPGRSYKGTIDKDDAAARMERAQKILRPLLEVDSDAIEAMLETALPFAASLAKSFLDRGFLSFDGLLSMARDLLVAHPEVLAEERSRIGMLLVDEFQDTDPLQYEIVLSLVATDQKSLVAGKLFIVGDPKQSIYRFRGADIAACQRAIDRVLDGGGHRCVLSTNFRSRPGITEPLNRLFDPAFRKAAPPVQPEYEPIHSGRPAVAGPNIRILSVAVAGAAARPNATQRRLAEARAIADAMREWRDAPPSDPGDPGDPDEDAAQARPGARKYSDMALLLPVMSDAPLYARALRERGIPFVMEGGRGFGEKSEVHLFLALLSHIADPTDAISFLAVLRSPLGAATDRELADYAQSGDPDVWLKLRFFAIAARLDEPGFEDRFPALVRTVRLIQGLRERAKNMPVERIVRLALDETPILPLAGIAYEGAQRIVNLRGLAARAAELSRAFGLSLAATVETLRLELEERRTGEPPIADEKLDAVSVLTVHKAKGLEFPFVAVGDLGRDMKKGNAGRNREATISWWSDGGGREGPAFSFRSGRQSIISAAQAVKALEENAFLEAEDIRRFYVATTRAKERLVLVQSEPKGGGTWTGLLSAWGYAPSGGGFPLEESFADGMVAHSVVTPVPGGSREGTESAFDFTGAVAAFDRAKDAAVAADVPWVVSPSSLEARRLAAGEPEDPRDEQDPGDEQEETELPGGPGVEAGTGHPADRRIAMAAGSVFHSLVERWDRRDPENLGWFLDATPEFARREAASRQLEAGPVEAEVRVILKGFLASGLPSRLARIDLIGREVPVHDPVAGVLFQGIADVLYRDTDGTVVVADHKTDLVDVRSEPALSAIEEQYRPQLRAYLRALRRVLQPETAVRAELWLARAGLVRQVPIGGI